MAERGVSAKGTTPTISTNEMTPSGVFFSWWRWLIFERRIIVGSREEAKAVCGLIREGVDFADDTLQRGLRLRSFGR